MLHADGSAEPPAKLADTAPMPDGFTVDDAGNLYVATLAGIQIFGPGGALRRTIAVPEQPANCAFGGADRRTLYITACTSLYQVISAIPGKP
ncbi:MAG: SMP-30/gluconolactonase/LRE family protein [Polyangiaceae bacterium]